MALVQVVMLKWIILFLGGGLCIYDFEKYMQTLPCDNIMSRVLSTLDVSEIVGLAIKNPNCFGFESRYLICQLMVNRFGTGNLLVPVLWDVLMQGNAMPDISLYLAAEMNEFKTLFTQIVHDERVTASAINQGSVHGSFTQTEALRRETFQLWIRDEGLLKGMIQLWTYLRNDSCVEAIADFGAGGGHYASFLNSTGLFSVWAFDGTRGIDQITQGRVSYLDLTESHSNLRNDGSLFEWIYSIEVAEHIPRDALGVYLSNVRSNVRTGLIISWATTSLGIGHVSHMPLSESRKLIESTTGMKFSENLSNALREWSTIDYIKSTVSVYLV